MCFDEIHVDGQAEVGFVSHVDHSVEHTEGRIVELRPNLVRLGVRAGGYVRILATPCRARHDILLSTLKKSRQAVFWHVWECSFTACPVPLVQTRVYLLPNIRTFTGNIPRFFHDVLRTWCVPKICSSTPSCACFQRSFAPDAVSSQTRT